MNNQTLFTSDRVENGTPSHVDKDFQMENINPARELRDGLIPVNLQKRLLIDGNSGDPRARRARG